MSKDYNSINLSLLTEYKNTFKIENKNFNYNSFKTYSNGYISKCSDDFVLKMSSNLNKLYVNLDKCYFEIKDWFEKYLENTIALESNLSNNSTISISESSVKNYVDSKLNNLINKNNINYNFLISNIAGADVLSGTISSVSNTNFFSYKENSVVQNSDQLSSTKENINSINIEKMLYNTSSKIESGVSKIFSDIEDTTNDLVMYAKKTSDYIGDTLLSTGAYLLNAVKKIFGTIINLILSLLKGVVNFFTELVSLPTYLSWGVAKLESYIIDGDTTDVDDTFSSIITKEKTFSNDISNSFYKTGAGRWLSENSYINPEGVVCNITTGIGEIGSVVLLAFFTGGTSLVASGDVTATEVATTFGNHMVNLNAVSAVGKEIQNSTSNGDDYGTITTKATITGIWNRFLGKTGIKIANSGINKGIKFASNTALNVTGNSIVNPFRDTLSAEKTFSENFKSRICLDTVITSAFSIFSNKINVTNYIFTNNNVKEAATETVENNISGEINSLSSTEMQEELVSNAAKKVSSSTESKITNVAKSKIEKEAKKVVEENEN